MSRRRTTSWLLIYRAFPYSRRFRSSRCPPAPSLLRCLGVPARLSGFNYLVETLLLLVNRPFETRLVTGEVYPVVAKQCNTTPIGVDQAIRTAVNQTWQEQNIPVYCALMGRSPAPHEPRPTSCEFLANVLMYVRIQMAECHY